LIVASIVTLSARDRVYQAPWHVIGQVARDAPARFFDEQLMNFEASRQPVQPASDDYRCSSPGEWVDDDATGRRSGFDEKRRQTFRHRRGVRYSTMLVIGLRNTYDISWIGTAE
jgi:hypothetical protein